MTGDLIYGIAVVPEQAINIASVTFTVDDQFCEVHDHFKLSPHGFYYIPIADVPFPVKKAQWLKLRLTVKLMSPKDSFNAYIYTKSFKDPWSFTRKSEIGPYKFAEYKLLYEFDWEIILEN